MTQTVRDYVTRAVNGESSSRVTCGVGATYQNANPKIHTRGRQGHHRTLEPAVLSRRLRSNRSSVRNDELRAANSWGQFKALLDVTDGYCRAGAVRTFTFGISFEDSLKRLRLRRVLC
jgi:hypothetical protein